MSIIQNLTQRTPVVQVDGRIVNQNAQKSQESLRSLEQGDRISGKIVSMTDEGGVKSAQIRLGDDTVISAKLQDGMNLKEGQTISFEVRGVSNQVTLTPLYENTSIDPTTLKALTAAGLEVNQDNVNMVKYMMENGQGIDKNSLVSMHQLVSSHPDADVSSIVQMKALNIPITDQNIGQFESYKNYEHQVVETMKSIMDDLPEAYNQLVQSGEGKAANDLYGGILDMLAKGAEHMEQTAERIEQGAAQNEAGASSAQTAEVENGALGKTIQGSMPEVSLTDSQNANANSVAGADSQNANGVNLSANNSAEAMSELSSETVDGEGNIILKGAEQDAVSNQEAAIDNAGGKTESKTGVSEQSILQNNGEDVLRTSDGKEEQSSQSLKASLQELDIVGAQKEVPEGKQFVSPKITLSNDLAGLVRELSESTGASGSEIQKLIAQAGSGKAEEVDQMALLKELARAYSESAHTSEKADAAFTRIFGNNEYNKLMKNIMQDEWLLKPDDVGVKENVENLYARLNSQAKQLTQQLTAALGADSKVAQSAANLQNNIDFMNQINQMFHYVQLPLKMADQDAHGDLYVYSNGKKKFEPGDTVSAILHLDMDNLGPIDVYVKMKDTNVKTNFYVADEGVIDLIEEHIGELNERLTKRGYTMEARTMLHTDMDNDSEDPPVSSILDAKKTGILAMTSFDARA